MRILGWIAAAVAVVWIGSVAWVYSLMKRPPEDFATHIAKLPQAAAFMLIPFETLWMHARAGALAPGDPAPDFNLETLDHKSRVELSSFRGVKPVVLIFGSYT
jgi:hypothetical protein